jgi:predicted nucleic acid-binding protein
VKLAADANVLLSSLIGGRARLILDNAQVTEVLTAESTFAEVEEYGLVLACKKRLPEDVVLLALAAMPVTIIPRSKYAASLSTARLKIGRRDPDDLDILALALQFRIPLWPNDKDFTDTGVEWLTTENLLRRLRLI